MPSNRMPPARAAARLVSSSCRRVRENAVLSVGAFVTARRAPLLFPDPWILEREKAGKICTEANGGNKGGDFGFLTRCTNSAYPTFPTHIPPLSKIFDLPGTFCLPPFFWMLKSASHECGIVAQTHALRIQNPHSKSPHEAQIPRLLPRSPRRRYQRAHCHCRIGGKSIGDMECRNRKLGHFNQQLEQRNLDQRQRCGFWRLVTMGVCGEYRHKRNDHHQRGQHLCQ